MKRTIVTSLAVVATASVLVGAFVVQPPPARASSPAIEAASPPSSLSLESELAPIAASGDLLCNLSVGDVSDIINHYNLDPNMQDVADALAKPFDCSAYGGLCSVLTATQAHAYACGAWMDLKNHYSITDVSNRAANRLADWASQSCTPDWDECEDICAPHSVMSCKGIIKNGSCREIALCDFLDDLRIPFLEFLTI